MEPSTPTTIVSSPRSSSSTGTTRSESVIIYASKDVKQLPLTVMQSPVSSPVYYFDSNQLVNCNLISIGSGWHTGDSERPTDSSESSINLYDVGSTIQLSPVSDECSENRSINHRTKLKRGRPKLETITSLIESSDENCGSTIKCNICKRTFPREKSLQAHLRIHTGERPYLCDFPDCGRRFAQSGQLRTHQRLHTGEKPFVCNFEGCENRFTHANRRCQTHPMAGVSRDKECFSPQGILKSNSSLSNASQEIIDWLNDYYRSVKRQGLKRKEICTSPTATSPKSQTSRPFKARKLDLDLDVEDTGNSSEENSAPIWKKKRAALQLQAKKDSNDNFNNDKIKENEVTNYEQLSSDRLMGALALIELANSPVIDYEVKCSNGAVNSSYESFDTSFNSSFNTSFNASFNSSFLAEELSDRNDYHHHLEDNYTLPKGLEVKVIKTEAVN